MLSTAQVAQLLHVTPKVVIRYVQDGKVKAHRLPGTRQYLFWRQDIIDLIEGSVVSPAEISPADDETEAAPAAPVNAEPRNRRRSGGQPAEGRARRR